MRLGPLHLKSNRDSKPNPVLQPGAVFQTKGQFGRPKGPRPFRAKCIPAQLLGPRFEAEGRKYDYDLDKERSTEVIKFWIRFIKFKFGDDKIFKSAEFEIIVINEL